MHNHQHQDMDESLIIVDVGQLVRIETFFSKNNNFCHLTRSSNLLVRNVGKGPRALVFTCILRSITNVAVKGKNS
jgi:hypothetical protein